VAQPHHLPQDTARLPPVETALLMAMRVWLDGRRRGQQEMPEVATVLAMLNCAHAAAPLEGLMAGLAMPAAAYRPIAIGCLCVRAVTADERRLLHVVALQQQGRSLESMILLRGLLRHEAAMTVQTAAGVLARTLAWSDQRLLAPETSVQLEIMATEASTASSLTMH
jgi:hypothetical protein